MPRQHATPDGPVDFTPEEEAEMDAYQAAQAVEAAKPPPISLADRLDALQAVVLAQAKGKPVPQDKVDVLDAVDAEVAAVDAKPA